MKREDMTRRDFLARMAAGAAAIAAASCGKAVTSDTEAKPAEGAMTYRLNHNTGDSVSILGYGCMRFPTKREDGRDVIDQEAVNRLIDYAIEHGVNYFDTAPVYHGGKSETATGIALSRHPRDSYYIATKMSNFDSSTWPRERSIEIFENSLRYLQTDYIDYLLLHSIGGGGMENFNHRFEENGILDWLIEQKEQGRIRNLGFSFHGDVAVFDQMLEYMDSGRVHWDFVQIQMNYIDWDHAGVKSSYLYHELTRRNIPVVIMEPLLGGRLANAPDQIAAKLKARRPDDSLAAWAFRFCGTYPNVLTALSGMTYMEHLQDNLRTYSPLEPLSDDEMQFLEIIADEMVANRTVPCTGCQYCMPCPYGVDIPAVFAHYNKCINEDNAPRSRRDPRYDAARRAFLAGYDNTVPRLRQAERCIECGQCLPLCPQEIKIPKQMAEIDAYAHRLRQGKA